VAPVIFKGARADGGEVTSLERLRRRLRYGRAVIVVSGLPRSGTSMAMRMLDAGGVPVLTDGLRVADDSNPKGYFELEAVKELDKGLDTSWLKDARGRAVKIISFLLTYLPETYDYRVIFMQRHLHEIIASQNTMLERLGEAAGQSSDEKMIDVYQRHLENVSRLLTKRRCFSVLKVGYRDVLTKPTDEARRMMDFLGTGLDIEKMAAVADGSLYRNRHAPLTS
jgi:hypothetical protein